MKISIRKKLLILVTTTGLGLTLTACANNDNEHIDMYSQSLTTLCLTDNEESYIDEVMNLGEQVGVSEVGKTIAYKQDLIESLNRLELYTQRLIQLKESGFKKVEEDSNGLIEKLFSSQDKIKPEELSEERKKELLSLSNDELKKILEEYSSGNQKDIEKARKNQELQYLFSHDQQWLIQNGCDLLISGLMRTLKASFCYASGLEPENFKDVKIAEDNGRKDHIVTVTDKKTGKVFKYKINENSGVFYDCLDSIYALQNLSPIASTQTIAESLNLMKECIVTPVEINEDKVLVPTITKEDSIQKVKKYK